DEMLRILHGHFASLAGRTVTVLGLAFKPDTDDVRESPAIPIIERLLAEGAVVRAHDPVVRTLPAVLEGSGVVLETDLDKALDGADAAVLVTRWRDYESLPEIVARLDTRLLVIDGRRLLPSDSVPNYDGVGR